MFGAAIAEKFGPANLRVGQIWEYREYQDSAWSNIPDGADSYDDYIQSVDNACKVLKIEARPGFMGIPVGRTVKVRFVKCTTAPHSEGEDIEFAADNFGPFFRLLWDPNADEKYGVYCGMCGNYCEYARFRQGFKCWACRNGWTT